MSPTESQLRAALREGEGDRVDAGLLIANANRARRERRHRINAGLGIAAAVALIGGFGSVLIGSTHDEGGSGSSAGGAAAPGASAHHGSADSAAANGGVAPRPSATTPPSAFSAQDARRACPAAPTHLLLPGGGGIGKFGSSDPLFSGDVAAFTACGYAPSGNHASVVIIGRQARIVADTLETAPSSTYRLGHTCTTPAAPISTIELLPVDSRGRNLRPVVVTVACPFRATNGTAVRYPATLPSAVTDVLRGRPR